MDLCFAGSLRNDAVDGQDCRRAADRPRSLEGVARLLEYPPGSASELEEDYLRTTRSRARSSSELFYGHETRASSRPAPEITPVRKTPAPEVLHA